MAKLSKAVNIKTSSDVICILFVAYIQLGGSHLESGLKDVSIR